METLVFLIKRLLRDKTAFFGAIIILSLILIAILAPILSTHPEDITEFHPSERLSGPSLEHFFGTDRMGSDVYSRLLFGARTTIFIAVIETFNAALLSLGGQSLLLFNPSNVQASTF